MRFSLPEGLALLLKRTLHRIQPRLPLWIGALCGFLAALLALVVGHPEWISLGWFVAVAAFWGFFGGMMATAFFLPEAWR